MSPARAAVLACGLFACVAAGAAQSASTSLTLAAESEPGTRLLLRGTVVDTKGAPVTDAIVDVYQTDASGAYTPQRPMDEPHARLKGTVRTDVRGAFEIRTIHPGGYRNAVKLGGEMRRIPAHIHLDVSAPGYAERRLQAVFEDDPLLSDAYWKEWVRRLGQPVLRTSRTETGESATVVIRLGR